MNSFTTNRLFGITAACAASFALAACDNTREAESETPVSEAEVSTELPETVVSDEQLEATANAAADMAATPPAVVVPVPADGGNTQQPTAGNGTQPQNQ